MIKLLFGFSCNLFIIILGREVQSLWESFVVYVCIVQKVRTPCSCHNFDAIDHKQVRKNS